MVEEADGANLVRGRKVRCLRIRTDRDALALKVPVGIGDEPARGTSSETARQLAPDSPMRARQAAQIAVLHRTVNDQCRASVVRVFPDLNPTSFGRHCRLLY